MTLCTSKCYLYWILILGQWAFLAELSVVSGRGLRLLVVPIFPASPPALLPRLFIHTVAAVLLLVKWAFKNIQVHVTLQKNLWISRNPFLFLLGNFLFPCWSFLVPSRSQPPLSDWSCVFMAIIVLSAASGSCSFHSIFLCVLWPVVSSFMALCLPVLPVFQTWLLRALMWHWLDCHNVTWSPITLLFSGSSALKYN